MQTPNNCYVLFGVHETGNGTRNKEVAIFSSKEKIVHYLYGSLDEKDKRLISMGKSLFIADESNYKYYLNNTYPLITGILAGYDGAYFTRYGGKIDPKIL